MYSRLLLLFTVSLCSGDVETNKTDQVPSSNMRSSDLSF